MVVEAYRETIVKRKKMKEEEFGFLCAKFGMPLRYVTDILKKIRNMDLYKLIYYLSSFNRKPTTCGSTTRVYLLI